MRKLLFWKSMFFAGTVSFSVGTITGFLAEKHDSDALVFIFLGAVGFGAIALLVGSVGLALKLSSSSAVAAGLVMLFLAFFVPMLAAKLGAHINIHGASFALLLFRSCSSLAGTILLVIGFVRTNHSNNCC